MTVSICIYLVYSPRSKAWESALLHPLLVPFLTGKFVFALGRGIRTFFVVWRELVRDRIQSQFNFFG